MDWDPGSLILWLDENEGVLSAIAAIVVIAGLLLRPIQALLFRIRRAPDPTAATSVNTEKVSRISPNSAHRIWVAPFEAIGDDTTTTLFAQGLTSDLASALSRISGVQVLLDDHDADHIVSGTLATHKDEVHVVARLHNPKSAEILWSRDFDLDREGFYRVQREIAVGIVSEIGGELQLRAFSEMNLIGTESTDAWALSQHSANIVIQRRGGARSWDEALEAAERAVEIDPNYAAAYGRIAALRAERITNFVSPNIKEDRTKALEAAERAVYLGVADPFVLMNCGQAWTLCGERNRGREALERARKAIPYDALCQLFVMYNLVATGTDEECREALQSAHKLRENFPEHPVTALYRGAIGHLYVRLGETDAAIDILREHYQSSPGISAFSVLLARMLFRQGHREEAMEIVQLLRQRGFLLTREYVESMGGHARADQELLELLDACDQQLLSVHI